MGWNNAVSDLAYKNSQRPTPAALTRSLRLHCAKVSIRVCVPGGQHEGGTVGFVTATQFVLERRDEIVDSDTMTCDTVQNKKYQEKCMTQGVQPALANLASTNSPLSTCS
jgi:hypothetical protein